MLDIIIRGGDVVTPQGVVRGDVAIAGETIAAVTAPDALAGQSGMREIDAGGRIVMPGGIDPHVHLHHVWNSDASRRRRHKLRAKALQY
jgi:dihydropyrimidinase